MENQVVIRPARDADVNALVALRAEMFRAMGTTERSSEWRDHARQWFADRIADASYGIFVIDSGERVVGCAMGAIRDAAPSPTVPEGRDVLISNVCVLPDERGHGYGRQVFAAVIDWTRSTGIARAELLASDDGRAMYERAGFTVTQQPAMRASLSLVHDGNE